MGTEERLIMISSCWGSSEDDASASDSRSSEDQMGEGLSDEDILDDDDTQSETPPLDEDDIFGEDLFEEGGSNVNFRKLAEAEGLPDSVRQALREAGKISLDMGLISEKVSDLEAQLKEAREFAELLGSPDEPGPGAREFVKEYVTREKQKQATEIDDDEYNNLLQSGGIDAAERYRLEKVNQAFKVKQSQLDKRLKALEDEKKEVDMQRKAQAARDNYRNFVLGLCKKAKLTKGESDAVLVEAAGKAALLGTEPDVKAIIVNKLRSRDSASDAMRRQTGQEKDTAAAVVGRPNQPSGGGAPGGSPPGIPEVTDKDKQDGYESWAARAAKAWRAGAK